MTYRIKDYKNLVLNTVYLSKKDAEEAKEIYERVFNKNFEIVENNGN